MRILIVDDHSVLRTALAAMLVQEADMEVVGAAADGKEAVEVACPLQPDVVLMDVNMPVMNGVEATRILASACPRVRVIGLSIFQHPEGAQSMLAAGAAGYVSKNDPPEVLLSTIRRLGADPRQPDLPYRAA